MGKIKIQRTKLHATAPRATKPAEEEVASFNFFAPSLELTSTNQKDAVQPSIPTDIFKNTPIDVSCVNVKLPDASETASVVSMGSSKQQMKKKSKRIMRHEAFMNKLDAARVAEKKKKEKKKRQATVIVGDMKPLSEALPELKQVVKQNTSPKPPLEKSRSCKSFKTQKKEMLQDINTFSQVLNATEFKSNPLECISSHLKSLIQQKQL